MPDINESTPREDYTIAGKTFSLAQPYAAGHTLSPNEAGALNQVFAENMRNNFAAKVKAAADANTFDQDVFQGQLDDYQSAYEFGVRTGGGGRSGDPVMAEAMDIARDKVRKALVKKGIALKDVSAKQISAKAKEAIDSGKYPDILALARQRVEATKEIADIELDSLDDGATISVEAAPAAASNGKGKASADAVA